MQDIPADLPPISDRAGVNDAVRVQILAAEHWDLLATRSMTWNQIFSRASMFITLTSAVVVALALVAQATHFDTRFRLFALLLLPIVLLLGIVTFIHLGEANGNDAVLVISMDRLRRAYLHLAPELQPYFPAIPPDENSYFGRPLGVGSGYLVINLLAGTPSIVATINIIVAAIIVAFIADAFGASSTMDVLVGVFSAILVGFAQARLVYLRVTAFRRSLQHQDPS